MSVLQEQIELLTLAQIYATLMNKQVADLMDDNDKKLLKLAKSALANYFLNKTP